MAFSHLPPQEQLSVICAYFLSMLAIHNLLVCIHFYTMHRFDRDMDDMDVMSLIEYVGPINVLEFFIY